MLGATLYAVFTLKHSACFGKQSLVDVKHIFGLSPKIVRMHFKPG